MKSAYAEFEDRLGRIASPRGSKAEIVRKAIEAQPGAFRLSDIEQACPGVGREWIRTLLSQMRKAGEVDCHGKGPAARWNLIDKSSGSGTISK